MRGFWSEEEIAGVRTPVNICACTCLTQCSYLTRNSLEKEGKGVAEKPKNFKWYLYWKYMEICLEVGVNECLIVCYVPGSRGISLGFFLIPARITGLVICR